MLQILILSSVLTAAHSTYFITKVNETVHHNVVFENNEPWNPEMYAKKIILRNITGSIFPRTFKLLTELEELYFAHSSIDFIHPKAFESIPNLKILKFSYNIQLPFINNEIFMHCKNLKKIEIGHNKFVDGYSEVLFSNLHNLTHIEITKESKIPRKFTKELFRNSTSLESIKIHFSNVTVIDSETFNGLENLNFLSLVENELVEIGPKAFRGQNLTHLYLGWNKLKDFTGKELYNLKKLRDLDISCNPLVEVNLDQIRKNAPNLQILSIPGSSLSCAKKKQLLEQSGWPFHVHMDQKELAKCEA